MGIAELWDRMVQLHVTADPRWVGVFYGAVVLICYLVVSQVRRKRRQAAAEKMQEWAGELDRQLKKIYQRQVRLVKFTKSRAREIRQEMEERLDQYGGRLGTVEDRIPNLYENLDEFRESLARVFESELGAVMHSFDSSVDSVLYQMKEQLQAGINNIEGIEEMVRSRRKAETKLISPSAEESAGPELESLESADEQAHTRVQEVERELEEHRAADEGEQEEDFEEAA